jgi:hypothetical protein
MTVIITEKGKNAQKLDRQNFTDEKELQEYIYENPETLPMYEIDEDIKVLILMREFPTNSGPIDAIGIDINGNIYIVETKLYKNADKRLVVAQALDYGAAIWAYYNDFSDFLIKVDAGTHKKFGMGMNQKIKEFFRFEDESLIEDLLENIKQNLNKGVFRFVVLMDHLEDRLKDLILFINKNSQFDVFAVELEYYKFKDHELMIPKLFGDEIKKDIEVATAKSSSQRKTWNEALFFEDLYKKVDVSYVPVIKKLYDFAKDIFDQIKWGTGSKDGSFSAVSYKVSQKSMFSVLTDGKLVFNYGWLDSTEIAKKYRDIFLAKLEEYTSFVDTLTDKQFKMYEVEDWAGQVDQIIRAIQETLNS